MKRIFTILMCMLLAIPSFSNSGEDDIEISGIFISQSHVKFEVSIVNDDNSTVVVQTKSTVFSYRIKLKVGNEYLIKFIKDDKVKELYVNADKPGFMQVDVDFKTNDAAQLCYSELKDDYHLYLLYNADE